MTDVNFWILYGLLFAIAVLLFKICRVLYRIHHDNLMAALRTDVRDIAQLIMQIGPGVLPDELVSRIFEGVSEMVQNEDGFNNGSGRT